MQLQIGNLALIHRNFKTSTISSTAILCDLKLKILPSIKIPRIKL